MIWSRWGFLSFLCIGVGVAVTLPLASALGLPNSGVHIGAMIFTVTALLNLALAFWAYPRLDRPRPVVVSRPLPQALRLPDGTLRTHEVVPALDREGQQVWTAPTSRLFFIPATRWWAIFGIFALVLWGVTLTQSIA